MRLIIMLFLIISVFTGCNNNNSQINYTTDKLPNSKIYTTKNVKKTHGTFSTKITDKTPNRLNNIKIGVEKLNGAKINPGETFSFNNHLGSRTEDKGYKKAIIFDGHGNKEKGYGGGICQISSTLYNAVLASGLEVTERHEHSKKVPYIEQGKDATVSYGADDFKFKNTSENVVNISAYIKDDVLNISVEG